MTPREVSAFHSAPSLDGFDYVVVGGGLQGGLIALSVLAHQPNAKLVLIERDGALGGNHTWCLHEGDVPPAAWDWLEPLVMKRWGAHDVIFPGHRRRMSQMYSAITSKRLDQVVRGRIGNAPNARVMTATALAVEAKSVTLENGTRVGGTLVIDARGPDRLRNDSKHFQKFVGLELLVEPTSAPEVPVLMDATVEQLDGFRFMYLLPFSQNRVLVEDTYYSDSAELDVDRLNEGILRYARERGMRVRGVIRQERGVLPLPLRPLAQSRQNRSPLCAGYAGGFFHPTTGYSLPPALRLALHVGTRAPSDIFDRRFDAMLEQHRTQVRFCCWLNKLLFGAFAQHQRYHVLERFYRLPADTIRRFYALETTPSDRARILCGRPPRGFSLRQLIFEGQPA